MKYIIFLLVLWVCCQACQEDDLDTYSGTSGVYFASRANGNSTDYTDHTSFSFAFAPVPDTVVRISVRGYGDVVGYDRPFKVSVEGGNAVEGVNFEILAEELVLKADSIFTYVPVRIFKEGCKDTTLSIDLRLERNEYFVQNVPFKVNGRDSIDITHHVLMFTDKLEMPDLWIGLGYWSETKFYFLNKEMGVDPEEWYDESKANELFKRVTGMGTYMVNYLNMFVEKNDYVNMPKDPLGPRGYMTFESSSGNKVTIPASWPAASKI